MGMGSSNGQIYHPDPITRMVLNNQQTMGIGKGKTQEQPMQSPINDLLARAMASQANPVSIAQLFPSMSNPSMSNPMTNYSGLLSNPMGNPMQGQYGAGRFLGGNAMTNYGSTSNAMNTM